MVRLERFIRWAERLVRDAERGDHDALFRIGFFNLSLLTVCVIVAVALFLVLVP